MNAPATETIEFAEEELAGKLLRIVVAQLEGQREPWSKVSEEKQEIALNAMRLSVESGVRDAVYVIASDRRTALHAVVESVTFKDGIKAVFSLNKGDGGRHELADAEGGTALVIVGELDKFATGTEKVGAAPAQRGLALSTKAADPAPEVLPPAPEAKEEPVPEVIEDGGAFVIVIGKGEDRVRYPGAPKSFKSAQRAEDWLQKEQAKKDETLLEGALEAFRKAGEEAGKKPEDERNYDEAYERVSQLYAQIFLDDHYTELSAAFADGFDKSLGDD